VLIYGRVSTGATPGAGKRILDQTPNATPAPINRLTKMLRHLSLETNLLLVRRIRPPRRECALNEQFVNQNTGYAIRMHAI
jgi:hypothetical protein